jgi:hypothetical protein
MLALRIALYITTLTCAFFFSFWELKLKRQLIDEFIEPSEQPESVSDYGILNDIKKSFRRERNLERLPPEVLSKYKVVRRLRLLFCVIFIAEVLILQSLYGPQSSR